MNKSLFKKFANRSFFIMDVIWDKQSYRPKAGQCKWGKKVLNHKLRSRIKREIQRVMSGYNE